MNNSEFNPVFVISLGISICVILYGYFFSSSLVNVSSEIMSWVSINFGWLYIFFVFFLCIFLTWLAFSKYGKIKLGKDGDVPDYSDFNWYSMLFCGGTGIGLVFWSIAEPLSHYASPPQGIVAGTVDAANFSIRTCFLHWGITQWMCFAIVGLCLAYVMFRKEEKAQISNLLTPIWGKKITEGWLGNTIDIFSVFVSFAGVATSLGLGVSQICGGLDFLFGVPNDASTWLMVIVAITCVFLISAVSGINKGIKFLSKVNTYIAFMLLAMAFIVGPKMYMFNTLVNGLGQHIQNFFGDSLMINPYGDNTWIMNWRVFYYAWFIAWTPFVGMFIARISKGRTIREFISGVVLIPSVFTIIWLSVFGAIALSTTADWSLENIKVLIACPQTAVFILFSEYPFSKIIAGLIVCLLATFFITSADSATYALSMMTSDGNFNAPKYKRVVWALAEATVAYVLLTAGSLKALQTISIAASLPFLFIMMAMVVALMKMLKGEAWFVDAGGK